MKKFVSLLLVLVMCLSLSVTAFAETADSSDNDIPTEETAPTEPMRPEETKWYYRILDDYYVQRRLWSLTYGRWLTEWETIGHL